MMKNLAMYQAGKVKIEAPALCFGFIENLF
jgi:hypothetical protein